MHDFAEEENFGPISAIQERCHTLVFCEDAAGEKGLFLFSLGTSKKTFIKPHTQ